MEFISIITDDEKTFRIDSRIKNISKLFLNLIQDYEHNTDKKLEGISSNHLNLLIDFCECIDYDPSIIDVINKPFIYDKYQDLFVSNKKLENFYNNLNEDNIIDYYQISDFFDVPILEEVIYFKLNQVFSTKENVELFFTKGLKDKTELLNISKKREISLMNKCIIYAEKKLNNLTDEEVIEILEKELK